MIALDHSLFALSAEPRGRFPIIVPLSEALHPKRVSFDKADESLDPVELYGRTIFHLHQSRLVVFPVEEISFQIHKQNLLMLWTEKRVYHIGLGPCLVNDPRWGPPSSRPWDNDDPDLVSIWAKQPASFEHLSATWIPATATLRAYAQEKGLKFPTVTVTYDQVGRYEYRESFGMESWQGFIVLDIPGTIISLPASSHVSIHTTPYTLPEP